MHDEAERGRDGAGDQRSVLERAEFEEVDVALESLPHVVGERGRDGGLADAARPRSVTKRSLSRRAASSGSTSSRPIIRTSRCGNDGGGAVRSGTCGTGAGAGARSPRCTGATKQ